MPNIFISYRREDGAGWAGRISRDLSNIFDEEHVFIDIDALSPGIDYVEEIDRRLQLCDVALVVIEPRWVSAVDRNNVRRLDNPDDLVRVEAFKALERRIP